MDGNGSGLTERISVESSDLSWHVLEMRCAGEHNYSACVMPWGSGADVCANSGPFHQRKGRSVDVAPGSGADVCANSGPFNRERVAFRHHGACVCAIPACLWVLPSPLRWALVARGGLQSASEMDLF